MVHGFHRDSSHRWIALNRSSVESDALDKFEFRVPKVADHQGRRKSCQTPGIRPAAAARPGDDHSGRRALSDGRL
jgi:hypothetical protein